LTAFGYTGANRREQMAVKAMELFDAYAKEALPKEAGYIISSAFSENSAYSRYEIVSYNNVKSIYANSDSLTFQTDGKKLYILVEPTNYPNKSIEPYCRSTEDQIPLRFSELDSLLCKNNARVYVAHQAVMSYGSFTVLRPTGMNFALIFYPQDDMIATIQGFLEKTINKEAAIPMVDAKKIAKLAAENVKKLLVSDFTTG
jgi:hypothetical protein